MARKNLTRGVAAPHRPPAPRAADAVAEEPEPTTALQERVRVALGRHRRASAATVAAGAALGAVVALAQPTTYTAEARLAVAGSDLAAQAVPGFALASQELAGNYARYVNNAQAQDALEEEIGADAGSVRDVSASPIAESNVVRIDVEADDAETAVAAADRVSQALVEAVNEGAEAADGPEATLQSYTDLSSQVAQAQQDVAAAQAAQGRATAAEDADAVARSTADLVAATSRLSILQVQQEALGDRYRSLVSRADSSTDLSTVMAAAVTGSDRTARVQRLGLLGLVAGAAAALGLSAWRDRRRTQLRGADLSQDTGDLAGVR